MAIKIVYILIFGIANFMIYAKLNKTGKVTKQQFYIFGIFFLVFVLLNTGLMRWDFLMKWRDFYPLLICFILPVFSFFWFTYFVQRRLLKLKARSERFFNFGTKVFSFFFLTLVYFIAFGAQCIFIFTPISSLPQ